MPSSPARIILASASPRRRELLALLELPFVVSSAYVSEEPLPEESPWDMVARLSLAKAAAVAAEEAGIVIGSDTSVSLARADGWLILGKPRDREDAARMLRLLGGRDHVVHTGYAVVDTRSGRASQGCVESQVRMRPISDIELERYLDSGIGDDKAGAYAIQDRDFALVEGLVGCAAATMGLPLCALGSVLLGMGLPVAAKDRVAAGCAALTGFDCCLHSDDDCPGWGIDGEADS